MRYIFFSKTDYCSFPWHCRWGNIGFSLLLHCLNGGRNYRQMAAVKWLPSNGCRQMVAVKWLLTHNFFFKVVGSIISFFLSFLLWNKIDPFFIQWPERSDNKKERNEYEPNSDNIQLLYHCVSTCRKSHQLLSILFFSHNCIGVPRK